jgi:hypothetical protein
MATLTPLSGPPPSAVTVPDTTPSLEGVACGIAMPAKTANKASVLIEPQEWTYPAPISALIFTESENSRNSTLFVRVERFADLDGRF